MTTKKTIKTKILSNDNLFLGLTIGSVATVPGVIAALTGNVWMMGAIIAGTIVALVTLPARGVAK
jgi:hypothetical protein